MKLSIIVPVYNEEKTVETVLKKLVDIKLPVSKEIIIIDDSSNDGTSEKINQFINKTKVKIKYLKHRQNLGKGGSIRSGVKISSGNYVLIQDADLEYNPNEIIKLLRPLNRTNNSIIAVYGSRFNDTPVSISPLYLVGNKILTAITNLLCGTNLSDMETGYKLLPRQFLEGFNIKSQHFDIEPEITVRLVKQKIKIIEIPIAYKGRSHLSGKKLTVLDAYEALKALFYFRFLSR